MFLFWFIRVLLAYLAAMHLLVFVTIYYSAHAVHYGCDPGLDHHNLVAEAHALSRSQQSSAATASEMAASAIAAALHPTTPGDQH